MKKNKYQGKFIVFEGIDGSGQTTQAQLMNNYLKENGCNVVLTKEPTLDSDAGRKIREVLDKKEKISPDKLQMLFAQDRKEHLEKLILPALKQGYIVISDRYFFSTFAFGALDLDLEWLIKINKNFIFPDVVFILDVSSEVAMNRIRTRGEGFKFFEKKEKLSRVRQNYLALSKRFENVYLIDGNLAIEKVFEEIKDIVWNKII